MKITHYSSPDLEFDSFEVSDGQAWCLYGSNSSGISSFIDIFSEGTSKDNNIQLPEKIETLSFARQQEIFEEELQKDDSDFLDKIDPGTPAHAFIENHEMLEDLIHAFNLQHCMNKGYRQLSSGESRKLILLGTISRKPDILLIENPYDGVDGVGCVEIDNTLSYLKEHGQQIIVTVNNPGDIPDWCTHLAVLQHGRIALQGTLEATRSQLAENGGGEQSLSITLAAASAERHDQNGSELIRLEDGFARYGDLEIFSSLQFSVDGGQHTLITGPNGSGKSTLLQIITGDNQNCYANNLRIFSIQRGSGESIWQLKKDMGIVSPDLHRNYYIPGSALQVVVSGFFDSIGVYSSVTPQQKKEALHWLEMIGVAHKAATSFRRLSYAEQRLCLIARALIKMPRLLILDEPTQGLDHNNRNSLLDFLEIIAEKKSSTILYASHRTDEFRPFFKQHVDLGKY